MNKTKGVAKFFKIICIIIFILVLVMFLGLLAGIYIFKSGDNAPSINGYRITLMNNDTMSPLVPKDSLILSQTTSAPKENSIVMYNKNGTNEFTVARFVEKTTVDGETVYKLVADNADGEIIISANSTLENVIYASYKAGAVVSFATSYKGVLVCAIVPCGLLILLEIILSIKGKRKEDKTEADALEEKADKFEKMVKKAEDKKSEKTKVEKTEDNKPETVKEEKKKKHKDQSPLTTLIEDKKEKGMSEDEDMPVISAKEAKALFSESVKKKEPQKNLDFIEPKPNGVKADKPKVAEKVVSKVVEDATDGEIDDMVEDILADVK